MRGEEEEKIEKVSILCKRASALEHTFLLFSSSSSSSSFKNDAFFVSLYSSPP